MTDLVYSKNHMTDIVVSSIDALTNVDEELLNEDLEIPANAIPPNPDDCEALPSQVHPSYPYGDPTNVNHPASQPRNDGDPASRMLFVDNMYTGAVTGALRWDELALDHLLPVDREKADAENATLARAAVGNLQAQNPREGISSDEDGNQEET